MTRAFPKPPTPMGEAWFMGIEREMYPQLKGWIGVRLDRAPAEDEPDWDEVTAIVVRSYRLIAPKTLAARLPETTKKP